MQNQPSQIAIDKPYEGLTDDLIASTASSMEACFSMHETKPFFLAGVEPADIYEWLDEAEYHKANMIFVNFDNNADASTFASVSGGQMMG